MIFLRVLRTSFIFIRYEMVGSKSDSQNRTRKIGGNRIEFSRIKDCEIMRDTESIVRSFKRYKELISLNHDK